jgi:preprotein translocase subunit SecB
MPNAVFPHCKQPVSRSTPEGFTASTLPEVGFAVLFRARVRPAIGREEDVMENFV